MCSVYVCVNCTCHVYRLGVVAVNRCRCCDRCACVDTHLTKPSLSLIRLMIVMWMLLYKRDGDSVVGFVLG